MKYNVIEELKIDLEEVKAYRDLQSEPFDFGQGLIHNDSNESEDVYYKIREQNLEETLIDLTESTNNVYRKKNRAYRYHKNRRAKKRLERLAKQGVYFVYETENKDTGAKYVKRFYVSGCRKYAKRETNRKIRGSKNNFSLKGGGYRKKFDYWWSVF